MVSLKKVCYINFKVLKGGRPAETTQSQSKSSSSRPIRPNFAPFLNSKYLLKTCKGCCNICTEHILWLNSYISVFTERRPLFFLHAYFRVILNCFKRITTSISVPISNGDLKTRYHLFGIDFFYGSCQDLLKIPLLIYT